MPLDTSNGWEVVPRSAPSSAHVAPETMEIIGKVSRSLYFNHTQARQRDNKTNCEWEAKYRLTCLNGDSALDAICGKSRNIIRKQQRVVFVEISLYRASWCQASVVAGEDVNAISLERRFQCFECSTSNWCVTLIREDDCVANILLVVEAREERKASLPFSFLISGVAGAEKWDPRVCFNSWLRGIIEISQHLIRRFT